ncbi:hypothetical protein Tco_0681266 [Tanacetum coccineum]|uniref:Uncharacterized protein n=1 Tax=Tanacetum coccineum TaxID=301880 RepID=A0ABQ4XPH6_9ASTR
MLDKGEKKEPQNNFSRIRVRNHNLSNPMHDVDIEKSYGPSDAMLKTLPSHSGFSQKKLVSFVTEIHTLSIDISLRDYPSLCVETLSRDSLTLPDHRFRQTVLQPHSSKVGFINHMLHTQAFKSQFFNVKIVEFYLPDHQRA